MVLLDLGVLVVDVQAGRDALGDDAGAEAARGAQTAAVDQAPVEDQADLVGTTGVEVVADDLLEGNWSARR